MSKQKQFFKDKIEEVTKVIWDFEFKIFKAFEMRESARKGRDQSISNMVNITKQLETDSTNEALLAEQKKIQESIDKFEGQMKMIDEQIGGIKPTDEDPGHPGLTEMIDSYASLRESYKKYLADL